MAHMGEYIMLRGIWYGLLNWANVRVLRRMRKESLLMALPSSHFVNFGMRHSCIPQCEDFQSTCIE
jgi:hypothetical protein